MWWSRKYGSKSRYEGLTEPRITPKIESLRYQETDLSVTEVGKYGRQANLIQKHLLGQQAKSTVQEEEMYDWRYDLGITDVEELRLITEFFSRTRERYLDQQEQEW